MRKKLKIISIICVVIVGITAIACANINHTNNNQNISQINNKKWKEKAPELFLNVGYSKLIESAPIISNKISESIVQLQGVITNPFGIRDDILEFIIMNVPETNKLAIRASIKLAQNDQLVYYSNLEQSKALELANNSSLMVACLSDYLPDNGWLNITRGIEKLMRNTQDRNAHMWQKDREFYSWKVIGSGMSVADEKNICEKGAF